MTVCKRAHIEESPIMTLDLIGKWTLEPAIPAVCEKENVAKLKSTDKMTKTSAGIKNKVFPFCITVKRPWEVLVSEQGNLLKGIDNKTFRR